jgi:hypothetical protein
VGLGERSQWAGPGHHLAHDAGKLVGVVGADLDAQVALADRGGDVALLGVMADVFIEVAPRYAMWPDGSSPAKLSP